MADEAKIDIPEVPPVPGLPEQVKAAWRKAYADAFKRAQVDHKDDPLMQRQVALGEANRIFRLDAPVDYDDAMDLAPWQVIKREAREGELKVVTIDGQKFSFPVPAPKPAAVAGPTRGGEKK